MEKASEVIHLQITKDYFFFLMKSQTIFKPRAKIKQNKILTILN